MKRLIFIGASLALLLAMCGSGSATAVAAKRKCKANWVFKKGKCHRRKVPHHPPPDTSPRDLVRATLTWQGAANLDLVVKDMQGRVAGYSSSAGRFVNEIPDATHEGDAVTGGTETFVDHIWHPLYPGFTGNRDFLFGACERDDVPEPVTATLSFIGAYGQPATTQEHFEPVGSGTGATHICGFYAG